jgi:hypothetical protein
VIHVDTAAWPALLAVALPLLPMMDTTTTITITTGMATPPSTMITITITSP